mmetsp:Transcript_81170/g.131508  ORF Transcript_81170/g.131508 Transcript_81170/m.131508 type:complete len:191 (-) Transcript_81170:83-655(-)
MPMLKEKCNLLFTLFVVIACTIWWAICMGQTRSMWGVLCMNSHVSSCNMLMSSTTCTVLFLFSSVGYGCLSVGHCAFGVFADMMCVFVFPRFEEDREQRHFEEQMKQIIQMESTTFDPCAVPVEPPALPQAPQTQVCLCVSACANRMGLGASRFFRSFPSRRTACGADGGGLQFTSLFTRAHARMCVCTR